MLSRDEMWTSMCRLLDRVDDVADRSSFLDACLDTLIAELGAQRGVVLLSAEGAPASVMAARGENRDLSLEEREEISRTMVREAERKGETILWEAGADPSSSMEALAITAALVAPLRSFEGRRGVLYLDFRDVRTVVDRGRLEFFRAAAALVSVVLAQSARLEVAREEARAAAAPLAEADGPSLEDLLWGAKMDKIRKEVQSSLYNSSSSILILGESGTGKTALARAVAEATGLRPVVRAVLGASDDLNTITSELFGHERGAFSGAMAKRVGLVELADKGILILDEILNLPRHAQQLLLDFTQFGTFRPLGYEKAEPKRVKVRLIAATNGDLDVAIKENRFRMDLYYRLAGVVLKIPTLRERREEIPWLAESYLLRSDPAREWRLSVALRRLLMSRELDWPGNVRQLEALVTRARERALAEDANAAELDTKHFDLEVKSAPTEETKLARPADSLPGALDGAERQFLEQTLKEMNGNVREAARAVGVSRATMYRKLQKHGLI